MGDVGLMGLRGQNMSWRDIKESCVLAEELGYSSLSMGESWGEDALTSLAQLAALTTRIRIGSSIIPVFARSSVADCGAVALRSSAIVGRYATWAPSFEIGASPRLPKSQPRLARDTHR